MKSLAIPFDLNTGLAPNYGSIQRRLSQMKGMYADENAFNISVKNDPLVYEFYDMHLPDKAGEIAFGTSIIYPGKVGAEYYMTKGHFHKVLETGEVYYCLHGVGYMMMESPEGDVETREMKPGTAVYVPPRYAHRSINIGPAEPLVTFFAFRGDAGHDYGTIETKGFRKLIVETGSGPAMVDNPKWKRSET
jgi:glucose-6-phosphate isomerase